MDKLRSTELEKNHAGWYPRTELHGSTSRTIIRDFESQGEELKISTIGGSSYCREWIEWATIVSEMSSSIDL
jgi:hypothetical protein